MNINTITTRPMISNIKRNVQTPENNNQSVSTDSTNINFGKKPSKMTEFFAEYYGKTMLNSSKIRNFCQKVSDMDKGNASRHFQTIGSLVTSGAYMKATLSQPDLDKSNARTLAINQALGFIVPTIAAYTVDAAMGGFNKQLEYRYSSMQEQKLALGEIASKEAKDKAIKKLGNRLKGFRTLIAIVTFTTIYRYVAPVAITPVANKLGKWLNEKIEEQENKNAQENSLKTPKIESDKKEYIIGEKESVSSVA